MKKLLLALSAVLITSFSGAVMAQVNVGDALPRVSDELMSATDGSPMAYYKPAGANGLLVMFSCNTCPFVVKNQPTTKEVLQYAKDHKVGVVIINSNEAKREGDDSFGAMKAYASAQGYDVPYLEDKGSVIADKFGANHTPEVYLFNNKNMLVYKGAMNDNPANPGSSKVNYVNNAIDAMIAGHPANPATTKSIGCSIKRKS